MYLDIDIRKLIYSDIDMRKLVVEIILNEIMKERDFYIDVVINNIHIDYASSLNHK